MSLSFSSSLLVGWTFLIAVGNIDFIFSGQLYSNLLPMHTAHFKHPAVEKLRFQRTVTDDTNNR